GAVELGSVRWRRDAHVACQNRPGADPGRRLTEPGHWRHGPEPQDRPTASRLRIASMTLAMWSRMASSAALGDRAWIASMILSCCGKEAAGRPGSSESVY